MDRLTLNVVLISEGFIGEIRAYLSLAGACVRVLARIDGLDQVGWTPDVVVVFADAFSEASVRAAIGRIHVAHRGTLVMIATAHAGRFHHERGTLICPKNLRGWMILAALRESREATGP